MDPVRARQFAIWKRMTFDQRWTLIGETIDFGLAVREQRLRAAHPTAGPDELRQLRRQLLLAHSPELIDHAVVEHWAQMAQAEDAWRACLRRIGEE